MRSAASLGSAKAPLTRTSQFRWWSRAPHLRATGGHGSEHRLYKIVVSLIIIIQVATVSAIAGQLRGGQTMSVIGPDHQLIWIAGITPFVTGTIIARATSLFNL